MNEEAIAREILDSAMRVHTALGPGLLEGAYEACLEHELSKRKRSVRRQLPIPLRYDGVLIDVGYRIDLLVDSSIVVEVKAIEKLLPVHRAQLLSYLRFGGYKLGLLLNFNTVHMRDGIRRVVNGL
ncbi:MAG TPA: GxxExxY protein [Burkholderiales bacterium]|nr:GxxExxY protein [Burkholderiales bacterium]